MTIIKRIAKPFFFACMLLTLSVSLSACSGYYKQKDSYVASSGSTTTLESDSQSCASSCNAEFERCGETGAAHSSVARGRLTGIIGAEADCRASLRRCLKTCRAR